MANKIKSLKNKCSKTGKTKYPDEKESDKAKIWIWGRDPSADITDLHSYLCPHCNFWHVGHISYYETEKKMYDSTNDTKEHIRNVHFFIDQIRKNLFNRRECHDFSKLQSPEKEMFDRFTPLLRDLQYGSPEYKQALVDMGPALDHHYEHNSHHPEHWENGIEDMSLLDLIEMLADWKAAGMRHKTGSLMDSLERNKVRFDISDPVYKILVNTAEELGWL